MGVTMDSYKIISVETIDGNKLNQNWHSPMQKIETDKGIYIDNEPGKTFGKFPPGCDWKLYLGKTVKAKITNSSNNEWISLESVTGGKITPDDNLVTTSKLANKLGITTKILIQKFVDSGYLEGQEGNYKLTSKGIEVGGEPRTGNHGPYFMWPITLEM